MATKKAGGSSRNGRDSNPKYLGVKRYGGEAVVAVWFSDELVGWDVVFRVRVVGLVLFFVFE